MGRSGTPEPATRLLLVEDAAPVLDVLREALERAGFTVDTARAATEAMTLLTARRYAALVADCILPDLAHWTGWQRSGCAAPTTPLVVYSGTVVLEDLEGLARDWGAVAVLQKPFVPAQLVAAVREAIETPADRGRHP
jgi:DNA-binding response OmpR family regulator